MCSLWNTLYIIWKTNLIILHSYYSRYLDTWWENHNDNIPTITIWFIVKWYLIRRNLLISRLVRSKSQHVCQMTSINTPILAQYEGIKQENKTSTNIRTYLLTLSVETRVRPESGSLQFMCWFWDSCWFWDLRVFIFSYCLFGGNCCNIFFLALLFWKIIGLFLETLLKNFFAFVFLYNRSE